MGKHTGIAWAECTWNPWRGCTKISAGCDHCYMYRDQARYGQDPRVVTRSKTTFRDPFRWKTPKRIFTCSWSDFFHGSADPWRDQAWDIIRQTPHHTYLILTKRPGRIPRHLPSDWGDGWPHVWLGVSVESQTETFRLQHLRDQCLNAKVSFFLKQLGGWPNQRSGAAAVLDGRTWTEIPARTNA